MSVAAGWSYDVYQPYLLPGTRFQFIMPNTPAMTGEGVLLFEERHSLEPEERRQIMELFACLGMVRELPSSLMGIGGAVSGCGPAFVDLLLEAFADAAVKYGRASGGYERCRLLSRRHDDPRRRRPGKSRSAGRLLKSRRRGHAGTALARRPDSRRNASARTHRISASPLAYRKKYKDRNGEELCM